MMKKRGLKMPTAFTVLIALIFVVGIITWFIPEVKSASIADMLGAPVAGFESALGVSLFVLVLGGFLGIVMKTGALNAAITTVILKLNGKELYMIPILMFLISLGGTTYGMAEETIAFYALVTATMVAAGFDSLTAAATILLGSTTGVLGSTVNPFVVSSSVSALVESGIVIDQTIIIAVGAISWLITYVIAACYVLRYAKKVKANKAATLLTKAEQEAVVEEYGVEKTAEVVFSGKQKLVMLLFAFSFVVMIIGMIPWPNFGITFFDGWSSYLTGNPLGLWYFSDLSTWFLIMSVVIGLVYGLKEKEIVSSFLSGAADLISVAMVIAVSRGISVIMSTTGLDGYILEAASNALAGTSSILFTAATYLVYIVLSFLIPSSSGMATVSMPIIGPLTQSLNLSPEITICILSGAVALVNAISPTSGVTMGGIAISRVEFGTWLKFVWKIFLILVIVHIAILSAAMAIL
ncbi:MAG TPA: YfcC family protein [Candidatus Onthosoma merdavium]|nr:YfcC family protein [Candidatus Onthosoma merdavium]